jgi:hypothetical protein
MTITVCPRCNEDFMYSPNQDTQLFRELKSNEEIKRDFPIQDETWESRRWNTDRTQSCDLSGGHDVICQDCHEKEEIENIAGFIQEKADQRGWENAEYFATEKYGKENTEAALKWLTENDVYYRQPFKEDK